MQSEMRGEARIEGNVKTWKREGDERKVNKLWEQNRQFFTRFPLGYKLGDKRIPMERVVTRGRISGRKEPDTYRKNEPREGYTPAAMRFGHEPPRKTGL